MFLVASLRYAASDDFNYLRGCLTLLPSTFHGLLVGAKFNAIVFTNYVYVKYE